MTTTEDDLHFEDDGGYDDCLCLEEVDFDEGEPNLFCSEGHAWVSRTFPGERQSGAGFREPDEETCPDCPEAGCGRTGHPSLEEARAAEGWSQCCECRDFVAPPGTAQLACAGCCS